jgi:hypothetical protein
VKARIISRGELPPAGSVLANDVRGADGRIALGKGKTLVEEDVRRLSELPWSELHVLVIESGDLHEEEAGRLLAAAVAGEGVEPRPMSGGTFPLAARHRGLLELDAARLARVNGIEDLVVFALPHGYVASEGELIGRVKVVPFVTREERVASAAEIAAGGLLRVRRFGPLRVAALLDEAVDESLLARARRALEEKLAFFGSDLVSMQSIRGGAEGLSAALREALSSGAQLVLIAGGQPMDPLDRALVALERAGARMERQGVPAHPGTLLWLAYAGEVPILGAPSCGLFSKPTALDLLLPRLFTGDRLTRSQLGELGAGGLLTPEMAWRLPPYRAGGPRGVLDAQ